MIDKKVLKLEPLLRSKNVRNKQNHVGRFYWMERRGMTSLPRFSPRSESRTATPSSEWMSSTGKLNCRCQAMEGPRQAGRVCSRVWSEEQLTYLNV